MFKKSIGTIKMEVMNIYHDGLPISNEETWFDNLFFTEFYLDCAFDIS